MVISNDRVKILKFKLDSLLDITMSINANLPVEELLAKYESILRDDLGIGKIMIIKQSGEWECILNAGFPKHLEKIDIEQKLLPLTDITFIPVEQQSDGVAIIIPIYNNNKALAFVLIGDIEEEGEGMSPVLKHIHYIQTLSSIITVAIENMRLQAESLQQEVFKKELELAAHMQQMLIPDRSQMPKNQYVHAYGYYHPHFDVGGDYYDCLSLSGTKTGFCIADISGKGISAALLMSNFLANFRALFTTDINFDVLVRKLNSIVVTNASGEKFITTFIARYDHESKVLEYVNAAHNPPVLYDLVTGEITHLNSTCVGIGMLDFIPSVRSQSVVIKNPSKLVCYTDGLSELKYPNGEFIGTTEIIKHISNHLSIEENINSLISDLGLQDSNPTVFDDVSIIAAELK
ncbi:MAG: serine/threonine-protein phosphatase [Bacteroidales bacterium]|nr:serine/threonine-protein phosphatase [Bacteroidales bacterium]